MLKVRKELCLGCGLCALNCPQGAISFPAGQAEIDEKRCNSCRRCLDVCPQEAIVEKIPVSMEDLKMMVTSLKEQTNGIIGRIERLMQ